MTSTTAPVPLTAPLFGATFSEAVSRFFKKYATFTGRASRSEFWFAYLAVFGVTAVLYIVMIIATAASLGVDEYGVATAGAGGMIVAPFLFIWGAGVTIPQLAVTWRRLHDINRSGAFFFLGLIPMVGGIILLVLLAQPSDPAGARFDA